MYAVLTDGTQQRVHETAIASTANHKQIRVLGLADKHRSRMTSQYQLVHRDTRMHRRCGSAALTNEQQPDGQAEFCDD